MNDFNQYTPQQIADVALAMTKGAFKLASIAKVFGPDAFKEGRGDTVYLNVPGALTARTRALDEVTAAIVLDSLSESQEPVKLDVHAYSAVGLSERDLSLDITDFSRQVLAPQVDAVVAKVESTVAAALAGVAVDATINGYDAANPVKTFTAGRAALRAKGIDPAESDLVAVVGSAVVDDLLDSGALDFGKTGDADALRNGSLGRIRGFRAIESGRVAENEIVFMTSDAIYLAHRAPAVPQGASFGQTVNSEGIGLRYLRDYDVMHTQDRSLVSTFVGAGILPLFAVDRNDETGEATVEEIPGGAIVKVATA